MQIQKKLLFFWLGYILFAQGTEDFMLFYNVYAYKDW